MAENIGNTDETCRGLTTARSHTVELKFQCRQYGERFILPSILFLGHLFLDYLDFVTR